MYGKPEAYPHLSGTTHSIQHTRVLLRDKKSWNPMTSQRIGIASFRQKKTTSSGRTLLPGSGRITEPLGVHKSTQ